MPGKRGSFTAKNAKVVKLNSAVYNATLNEVMLTPKKPFALTKPIQFQVNGLLPSGLQDIEGRLIDGDHDGLSGGNAVAMLRPKGVTLSALVSTSASGDPIPHAIAAFGVNGEEMIVVAPSGGSAHSKHKHLTK